VTNNPWRRVLEIVRRRADPDAIGPLADQRLLARFVANGDPSAFELLVWRHGSLVFGTCRRILDDVHAAEDAFQATFLALARKPRAVRSGAALAGWLHRVALRISNKLRVSRTLQTRAEQAAAQADEVSPTNVEQNEIAAVVDEEIDRLPERLRRAVVLCYLDGRTTEQAAAILDCPRGTVLSRLHTARDRLRDRLTRRGLTLPVAGISALIFASESSATLVPLAVRAALTVASPIVTNLAQGVLHAMFLSKVKLATALALGIALATAGIGWVAVPGSGPALVQAEEPKLIDAAFNGKIVVTIYRRAGNQSGTLALRNPQVVLLGNRTFFRGVVVREFEDLTHRSLFDGHESFVAVSDIESLAVFEDPDRSKK
jgi:RNA polymerase sigma factor (sigma-70 family)